jgi:hypothetical protein
VGALDLNLSVPRDEDGFAHPSPSLAAATRDPPSSSIAAAATAQPTSPSGPVTGNVAGGFDTGGIVVEGGETLDEVELAGLVLDVEESGGLVELDVSGTLVVGGVDDDVVEGGDVMVVVVESGWHLIVILPSTEVARAKWLTTCNSSPITTVDVDWCTPPSESSVPVTVIVGMPPSIVT